MSSDHELNAFDAASDDEDDWEEVEVPEHQKHIEITLQSAANSKNEDAAKKKGISYAERLLRIDCHKAHTVILLANAKVRNEWINDELLQARLLSLTPLTLQNEFAMIHKSRIPDQGARGRAFERAMQHLAEWWAHSFFEVLPEGHIRNRTFDEIQSQLEKYGLLDDDEPEAPIDPEILEAILGGEQETIRGPQSLMKHALMKCGSRDVSSQLFTSLCRGLAIPSRLVVSLQSVPWKSSVGKPKPRYTRQGKNEPTDKDGDQVIDDSPVASSSKGKGKAPIFEGTGRRLDGTPVPKSDKWKEKATAHIKLRKQRDRGRKLGEFTSGPIELASPDPTRTPPVFWTEFFSRPDGRWLPVDPIRAIVNKRKAFDPTPLTNAPSTGAAASTSTIAFPQPTRWSNVLKGYKEENRMLYVMAFEEDGYARDVTRRYAREYSAKVAKAQGGSGGANAGGGKARQDWWAKVVNMAKRPYQLHRDDIEDQELQATQMMEGMPTTISGFKDHPLYALARHLKQTEVIHPPPPDTPELGKFRGEPVYPRSSVLPLKSAETWMRTEGRIVRAGSQPLKTIKARPGTVNRQRELEVLKDELRDAGDVFNGDVMQGLYARSQTELYVPEPIIEGKIPKNNFGNIDLYVESMLPRGAVHIPFKGVAKIAKKLGFDYAEAVTGFEFKKRRAHPVVAGVVVAAENESALLEAYWEAQKQAEDKARAKREEKALQHWVRLVQGLRIRQRLQEQYADRSNEPGGTSIPANLRTKTKGKARSRKNAGGEEDTPVRGLEDGDRGLEHGTELVADKASGVGGGFLVEAGDVVEAFHLPKYNPLLLESSSNPFARSHPFGRHGGHTIGRGGAAATGENAKGRDLQEGSGGDEEEPDRTAIEYVTYDLDDDGDLDMHGYAPMEVDTNGNDKERSSTGVGTATPGPPLTDYSSPLSFADLGTRSLVPGENGDAGDNHDDEYAPRTMEDLITAEEAANAKSNVKLKFNLNAGASQTPTGSGGEGWRGLTCLGPGGDGVGVGQDAGNDENDGVCAETVAVAEGAGELEPASRAGGRRLRSSRSAIDTSAPSISAATPHTRGSNSASIVKGKKAGVASASGVLSTQKGQKGNKPAVKKKAATKAASKRKRGKKQQEEDEEEDTNSPRKRPRATPVDDIPHHESAPVVETPAPSSGRSLRPRAPKTAAQLKEAADAEVAYRRAVTQ